MLRYNRQIILSGFDFAGQERLKASCAMIAGQGGLGIAAGCILPHWHWPVMLLNFDTISLSNLLRQVLHTDDRIGHESRLVPPGVRGG